ncbi:MAG: phosphatase PAP2 family protein [Planctomycetia bacterium]|nr:phosphatase PAP2 family protein [Planctomycetia bacterium]
MNLASPPAGPAQARPSRPVLLAAAVLLAVTALLSLAALLPEVDLNGNASVAAYYMAASGGPWSWLMLLACTVWLVARAGISNRQRLGEAALIIAVLAVAIGGGFLLNEHGIKAVVGVPRPNIQQLAKAGALGMSPQEFYNLPGKAPQRDYLRARLNDPTFDAVPLNDLVRSHWIEETGFSFPSSHSLASMGIAAFFLAFALSCRCSGRRAAGALLVVWAVAVCLSRPVLRVHSTADICFGALEGVVLGLGAFVLVRHILSRNGSTWPVGV